jgi:hypothetical protein
MRRHSRAGGKLPKTRRNEAALKRRNAQQAWTFNQSFAEWGRGVFFGRTGQSMRLIYRPPAA